ncbi:MAG: 50S ribosomal protein L18e [Candidatus Bilamarchaeum sp.]|jgi:large subunit ribosomal protein L18e
MKKKENNALVSLIETLKKADKPIWKKVAEELSKPRRSKVEVNLSKLNEYADEKVTILVPGKVLGSGSISKKVNVAAYSFSQSAVQIITQAGGKMMSIESLKSSNPQGKGVVIIK